MYKGRGCALGIYGGLPLTGSVLASRSDPDRRLEKDEENRKVWIAPGERLRKLIEERPYEAVDNLYACLVGIHDKKGRPASAAFNGRMSNRIGPMMGRGLSGPTALKKILEVYAPDKANDPRLGAVASAPPFREGGYDFHLGSFHTSFVRPMIKRAGLTVGNQLRYITQAECGKVQSAGLDSGSSPNELAEQLFFEVLGSIPEFGCGAGVCLVDSDDFRFGVYNHER